MITAAAACLALVPPVAPVQEEEVDLVDRIAAYAERARDEHDLEGLVLVVGVGDDVLLARGWGRLPGGALADPEAPFRAEPLLDTLVALATMQLVDEGEVALDAPIGRYLEGFAWDDDEDVTVHHLLAHTSGLMGWSRGLARAAREDADRDALLAIVKEQGLQATPGECFAYSESNVLLLGALVEALRGEPLADVIEERVLAPAEVRSSGFGVEDAPPPDPSSIGTREIGGEVVRAPEGVHPFGEDELCASALDLFRLRRAMSARALVEDASVQAMTSGKRLSDGSETGYGYGLNVTALGDLEGVAAGGSAEGTTVHVAYYPDPEVTVVALVAAEDAPIVSLERDVARLVLDLPLPGVQDLELGERLSERLVGRYKLGCTMLTVRRDEEGRLELSASDRSPVTMLYQGRRSFVARHDPEVRFEFLVEDDGGPAHTLLLDEHGQLSEAVRFD